MESQEDKKVFKPKMRITTLNKDGSYLQDRLVDAYTELNTGPKFQHKGPVRLEITLQTKQDIDAFKTYIDQLSGNLPLKEITGRGRPSNSPTANLESPREDIMLKVEEMAKNGENQDAIIKYLRELGFVFILTEDLLYYFPDFPFKSKDIGEANNNGQYLQSYSWMIRCIKRAKDPKSDKFDPMILFGFKVMNGPSKKVIPYLFKERKHPLQINTGKKILTFSTVEFTKMPAWMLPEERMKFSAEQRQLLENPDKQPSKFFLRWSHDVLLPDSIHEKFMKLNKGIIFKNDLK